MPRLIDALLLGSRQRRQHLDQLGDRLRADMGLPATQMRRAQPFLLGSLIAR